MNQYTKPQSTVAHFKYINICIMRVPEGEEKEKKIVFKEIMAENFSNLMKNMYLHIPEAY